MCRRKTAYFYFYYRHAFFLRIIHAVLHAIQFTVLYTGYTVAIKLSKAIKFMNANLFIKCTFILKNILLVWLSILTNKFEFQ